MVQVYVSQLRKAFRGNSNGAEIVTRGQGYELRLGSGEVDARRFERLIADGEPREALSLWRGPPLPAQDNGRAVRWDIRPASLAKHACDVAGRRLSRAERSEFLPGREYAPAC
jgi:hypothetical protein